MKSMENEELQFLQKTIGDRAEILANMDYDPSDPYAEEKNGKAVESLTRAMENIERIISMRRRATWDRT